jgi:hypothetical protein
MQARKTATDMPTSLRGIAKRVHRRMRQCEASDPEEPGAGKPHAGICAGAVGKPAVLRLRHRAGPSLRY